MNDIFVVGKIKQLGRQLMTLDSNVLGNQYSANLYLELELDNTSSNPFKGMLLKSVCSVNQKNSFFELPITEKENKKYIVLNQDVFKEDGFVKISLAGINDDKVVITTNAIILFVDETNSFITKTAPPEDYYEILVLNAMKSWFAISVQPIFDSEKNIIDELIETSSNQQDAIDDTLLNFNNKLAAGEFKGEKGDTGAQGEKGDTGAQGEKGEKGDTGAGSTWRDVANKPETFPPSEHNHDEFYFKKNLVNGYYGFDDILAYLRTPIQGLLPNTKNSESCNLGSETWLFNSFYARNFYKNGVPMPNNNETPEIISDASKPNCYAFKFPSGLLICIEYSSIYGTPNASGALYYINAPIPPKHVAAFKEKIQTFSYAMNDGRDVIGSQIARLNTMDMTGVNNAMYIYSLNKTQGGFYAYFVTVGRWKL